MLFLRGDSPTQVSVAVLLDNFQSASGAMEREKQEMENLEMRNDSPVPRPRLPPLLVPFHIPFLSRFLNDSPVQQDSSLASSRAPPARPPARLLFGRGALPSPRPRIRQSLLASSFFHVSHSQSMCLDHSEQTNQKYSHLRRIQPVFSSFSYCSSVSFFILLFAHACP